SKADVKSWPLISRLVDAAGTLYLERERKRDALRVIHVMADALRAGQTVAVFPEGTTSTGHGLLPFHANLLQAAISTSTPVQPVALRFSDATHAVSEALESVGATTLLQSLWRSACGQGVVARLVLLPPRASAGAGLPSCCARILRRRSAFSFPKPDAPPRRPPRPPQWRRPGSSCGSASARRSTRRRVECRSEC